MPTADEITGDDLIAVGADLRPETLITAYASGLFPMPVGRRRLGWWSPDPRGVLPLDRLVVSKSLRRSRQRYSVTIDRSFREVVQACATIPRPHGWITPAIEDAYQTLHDLGVAHSIETWDDAGSLVGGLYGVNLGGFFAGESMFQRATDASKVALVALVEILATTTGALLDVQWRTDHLASLGVIELPRSEYLQLIPPAVAALPPVAFRSPRSLP